MGTRSTTRVYEITDGASPSALKKLKPLLTLYRQMDGYPSGHGADISALTENMTIVNGFDSGHNIGTHANGAGCFAAQLVEGLKDSIGNVYIYPHDAEDQEYNYHIYVQAEEKWAKKPRSSLILIRVVAHDNKEIFNGNAKAFAAWVTSETED